MFWRERFKGVILKHGHWEKKANFISRWPRVETPLCNFVIVFPKADYLNSFFSLKFSFLTCCKILFKRAILISHGVGYIKKKKNLYLSLHLANIYWVLTRTQTVVLKWYWYEAKDIDFLSLWCCYTFTTNIYMPEHSYLSQEYSHKFNYNLNDAPGFRLFAQAGTT